MRRLFTSGLAMLLLALFALPLLAPLLALTTPTRNPSDLPACCRRNGAHHCAMSLAAASAIARTQFLARPRQFDPPVQPCPFRTTALAPSAPSPFTPGLTAARSLFSALQSHPTGCIQTECRRRIARSRSRYKRGPPASSAHLLLS